MRALCTGAGGFIASALMRKILETTDWDVVAIDSFRHRGVTDRITAQCSGTALPGYGSRLRVITHDLAAPVSPQMAEQIGDIDYLLALASGSGVGDSLASPRAFAENNVAVALTTLEYARQARPRHIVWVSTDEVYGAAAPGQERAHCEWDPVVPSSPYSASKAAQEAFAVAWWRSHGLPLTIVNMQNVYGPFQGSEKFIPLVISAVLDGRTVRMHGTANDPVSRGWLNVSDVASALLYVAVRLPAAEFGPAARPSRWNIAGDTVLSNLEVAEAIAREAGHPLRWEWSDERAGLDAHYALDGSKLAASGWKPSVPFGEGLAATVQWYLKNPQWLLP